MLPGVSRRQLLVVMHRSPRAKATDETDAAPLIHGLSVMVDLDRGDCGHFGWHWSNDSVFGVEKARRALVRSAPPGFPRLRSGQALRLRATGTVSRDKSVRRSAQDGGFVGSLTEVERKLLSIFVRGRCSRKTLQGWLHQLTRIATCLFARGLVFWSVVQGCR